MQKGHLVSPRKRFSEPVPVPVPQATLIPRPLALPREGSGVERSHLPAGGLPAVSTFAFQLWIPREIL